jgi:NADH-quinone oxidoreductase subunit E
VKHLIPEFDQLRARFPEGFASSMTLPCLRRIQEELDHEESRHTE